MTYGRITYLVFPSAFWSFGALQENHCCVVILHTKNNIQCIKFFSRYLVIMQDATWRPNFASRSNENLSFINRKIVNHTNNIWGPRPLLVHLFFNTSYAVEQSMTCNQISRIGGQDSLNALNHRLLRGMQCTM